MSETLPLQVDPIYNVSYPVISYTGTAWCPIYCVVNDNTYKSTASNKLEYNPDDVTLDELYYYERIGGSVTSLECNAFSIVYGIQINAPLITTLTFNNYTYGGVFINCSNLITLTMPKLISTTSYAGLDISSTVLQTLSLPNLEEIPNFNTLDLPALTTLNMPKIKSIGEIFWSLNGMNSINLPSLQYLNTSLTISSSSAINSEFTNLSYIGGDINISCQNMKGFLIPSIKYIGGNISLDTNLDANLVSAFLILIFSLNGTNGSTVYENKTIDLRYGNAAPTMMGSLIADSLRSRGCTVYTN